MGVMKPNLLTPHWDNKGSISIGKENTQPLILLGMPFIFIRKYILELQQQNHTPCEQFNTFIILNWINNSFPAVLKDVLSKVLSIIS